MALDKGSRVRVLRAPDHYPETIVGREGRVDSYFTDSLVWVKLDESLPDPGAGEGYRWVYFLGPADHLEEAS
jgi:hypothetical protein